MNTSQTVRDSVVVGLSVAGLAYLTFLAISRFPSSDDVVAVLGIVIAPIGALAGGVFGAQSGARSGEAKAEAAQQRAEVAEEQRRQVLEAVPQVREGIAATRDAVREAVAVLHAGGVSPAGLSTVRFLAPPETLTEGDLAGDEVTLPKGQHVELWDIPVEPLNAALDRLSQLEGQLTAIVNGSRRRP